MRHVQLTWAVNSDDLRRFVLDLDRRFARAFVIDLCRNHRDCNSETDSTWQTEEGVNATSEGLARSTCDTSEAGSEHSSHAIRASVEDIFGEDQGVSADAANEAGEGMLMDGSCPLGVVYPKSSLMSGKHWEGVGYSNRGDDCCRGIATSGRELARGGDLPSGQFGASSRFDSSGNSSVLRIGDLSGRTRSVFEAKKHETIFRTPTTTEGNHVDFPGVEYLSENAHSPNTSLEYSSRRVHYSSKVEQISEVSGDEESSTAPPTSDTDVSCEARAMDLRMMPLPATRAFLDELMPLYERLQPAVNRWVSQVLLRSWCGVSHFLQQIGVISHRMSNEHTAHFLSRFHFSSSSAFDNGVSCSRCEFLTTSISIPPIGCVTTPLLGSNNISRQGCGYSFSPCGPSAAVRLNFPTKNPVPCLGGGGDARSKIGCGWR